MEMKRIVVIVIINLMLCVNGKGQNLVPNGGFEIVTSCDSLGGGFNYTIAPPWDSPTTGGSPDLFNSCSTYSNFSSPSNFTGYQYPHSGNGYAGADFFQSSGGAYREYIQVKLDSVLISQHKYCINFFVSFSKGYDCATNNIGMCFSNTHTSVFGGYRLNLIPQFLDTNIISDTTNWTLISGQYNAIGGEQYIILGNFNTAATTDTLSVHGGFDSYYYIDDVSIVDCTNVGVEELSKENEITISPNPATTSISITSTNNIKEIKLINLLGEEVIITNYQLRITNAVTMDVSSVSKGIYFVEVTDAKDKVINKKVVVQ